MLPVQHPGLGVVQDNGDWEHVAEHVMPVESGVPEPPAVRRLLPEERGAGLDLQGQQLATWPLGTVERLDVRVDAVVLDRLLPNSQPHASNTIDALTRIRLVRGGVTSGSPSKLKPPRAAYGRAQACVSPAPSAASPQMTVSIVEAPVAAGAT
jgi:hypothetical protein